MPAWSVECNKNFYHVCFNFCAGKRIRRKNTAEEKRLMKRKRQQRHAVMNKIDLTKKLMEKKQECSFNRKLASMYWDRWRNEVERRKYSTQKQPQITKIKYARLFEVPPSHLCSLPSNEQSYLGQGSFATVRKCLYRGMHVAVKEYFEGIDIEMIQHEASFMCKLSHLSIPLFFGANISVQPYYIVMQFCGIDGKSESNYSKTAVLS